MVSVCHNTNTYTASLSVLFKVLLDQLIEPTDDARTEHQYANNENPP